MSRTVVIRKRVDRNFTALSNNLIKDNRLSWKALGLLTYLLSLPSDFKLRLESLAKQRSSGRDATRSGLRELEVAGYLLIERAHDEMGRFASTAWIISSEPFESGERPCTESPKTVEPETAVPEADKPPLINIHKHKETQGESNTTTNAADFSSRPVGLSDSAWSAITRALRDVPHDDAAALIEELASAIRSGVIQKTPEQWFYGLKKRYDKGEFVATRRSKVYSHAPALALGEASQKPRMKLSRAEADVKLAELRASRGAEVAPA